MKKRLHIYYTGRVQGVGFRFTTEDIASELGVCGWVKNLGDGRVEVVVEAEEELLKEMNALNIGPIGLGGKTTVLGVNILTYPTHIAGLPVCVNLSCHVLRSASALL